MPYIGNTPADKFLTLAKQNFSTSATTSYTLDSAVSSTQNIALFINNVRQSPVDAYSVSGTALTLTSATAGTDEMYCVYLGKTVGTVSPSSDSVTTAMLQANVVTGAKLNTDVISAQTALGATPADTDELLVSDAGVLKKVDYSYLKGGANTPNFHAKTSSQSISASTNTTVIFSAEDFDTANLYNTSDGKFTVTSDYTGKYFFYAAVKYASSSISRNDITIRKNGTAVLRTEFGNSTSYPTVLVSGMVNLSSASDYVTVVVNQNDGTKSLSGESEGNFFGGYKIIE